MNRRPSPPSPAARRRSLATALALVCTAAAGAAGAPATPGGSATPPPTLALTGLYSDPHARVVAPGIFPFSPQYPLWSDGATKRRWIWLPPGGKIDASNPEVWQFPVGTKFWKEFALGVPVETRYMERLANGSWLFATYRWNSVGTVATLAPARGVRRAAEIEPGTSYDLPSRTDCRSCHFGHPSTVLGFSALQLSSDRDPLALHASEPEAGSVDLRRLVRRGLVVGLPPEVVSRPPRVRADSPEGRAALGYLHANCSHCHNGRGSLASLGLSFEVTAHGVPDAIATAVGRAATFRPQGAEVATVVAAGDPAHSLLVGRLSSRDPLLQMPPLGTRSVDDRAVALVSEWVRVELEAQFRGAPAPPRFLAAHDAALSKEDVP